MKLEIVTFLLHSLDAVVKHYLSSSGFDTSDPRVLRLVSLAAQKFVSDVANDALQHCKMRNAGNTPRIIREIESIFMYLFTLLF